MKGNTLELSNTQAAVGSDCDNPNYVCDSCKTLADLRETVKVRLRMNRGLRWASLGVIVSAAAVVALLIFGAKQPAGVAFGYLIASIIFCWIPTE